MYQNKYPKMIISFGIYSINRPEAGYGGVHIYIYTCMYPNEHLYAPRDTEIWTYINR